MPGHLNNSEVLEHFLYDHRPLRLNPDDYERVCQIPKKKVCLCALNVQKMTMKVHTNNAWILISDTVIFVQSANFRDLPGVRVRADNKVEWDPNVERKKVSSGKPLVRFGFQICQVFLFEAI